MPLLLAFVLVAAPAASPAPALRLRGLDRLYFTEVGGTGELTAPAAVAGLLPRTLVRGRPAARSPDDSDESEDQELAVTDVALPLPSWPRRVALRQVVDSSHPRISELWIALYDGGRRRDVWHFQALPSLTDGKLLPNYWIESARPGPGGAVIVRLRGVMFRPQGAWWATGKVLTLTLANGALTLGHVRNAFGFNRGYDLGDESAPPALGVNVEREVAGRFERRDLDPVPEDVMKACGAAPDGVGGAWDDLEKVAECITRDPGATVSSRSPQEPSFAERGYDPKRRQP
jgi:hypothetical protein